MLDIWSSRVKAGTQGCIGVDSMLRGGGVENERKQGPVLQ